LQASQHSEELKNNFEEVAAKIKRGSCPLILDFFHDISHKKR